MPSAGKDPRLVESGRRGAEKRWGPARHVDLSTCDPALRRLILALIAAAESNDPRKEAQA